ncbi:hypothetical protein F2P81_005392 [Scophthalmus maximus]|uniref:Uncharacterized protein n=1 Tax=Scophthalmus maximus TaxID=52904 RepID=A0A6A4TDH0_SCOMX|nr:hypothetical protein F2P81_005392 [Scophthalmus maximus]
MYRENELYVQCCPPLFLPFFRSSQRKTRVGETLLAATFGLPGRHDRHKTTHVFSKRVMRRGVQGCAAERNVRPNTVCERFVWIRVARSLTYRCLCHGKREICLVAGKENRATRRDREKGGGEFGFGRVHNGRNICGTGPVPWWSSPLANLPDSTRSDIFCEFDIAAGGEKEFRKMSGASFAEKCLLTFSLEDFHQHRNLKRFPNTQTRPAVTWCYQWSDGFNYGKRGSTRLVQTVANVCDSP